MQAFSSCGEQGLLFLAIHGVLIAVASHVSEHRRQELRHMGSAVAACEPWSSGGSRSFSMWAWVLRSMWNLSGPGIELVALHWQVDSYALRHQGSPCFFKVTS